MIDGQNSNSSVLTGLSQPLNNPDIVAEFRLITNQFAPNMAGPPDQLVNIVTKNGTNQLHGSVFCSTTIIISMHPPILTRT
jgi:hypothetical protein